MSCVGSSPHTLQLHLWNKLVPETQSCRASYLSGKGMGPKHRQRHGMLSSHWECTLGTWCRCSPNLQRHIPESSPWLGRTDITMDIYNNSNQKAEKWISGFLITLNLLGEARKPLTGLEFALCPVISARDRNVKQSLHGIPQGHIAETSELLRISVSGSF